MELLYPDPEIRHEIYWRRKTVVSSHDLATFAFRPVSLEIEGERVLGPVAGNAGSGVGLVVALGKDASCLLCLRAVPLNLPRIRNLRFKTYREYDLGDRTTQLPLFQMGKTQFLRLCGLQALSACPSLSTFLLKPSCVSLPRRNRALLEGAGDLRLCREAVSVWLPYSDPRIKMHALEFPDTVALITREVNRKGETATNAQLVPYYDTSIGEIMARCGSAHLDEIGEITIGQRRFPVKQFLTRPTAWLEFCQAIDPASGTLLVHDSLSTSVLQLSRLVCFTLASEMEEKPPTRRVKEIGQAQARLVLLDQGGASGEVVRAEPRKWRPRGGGSVIANELKYLVSITSNGTTYNMRSEAVADFKSREWRKKNRFRINELAFAGQKPVVDLGETALFSYRRGQPEIIRTITGPRMQVVVAPKTTTLNVYITHVDDRKNDLYVEGFRSTNGFTAIPLDQLHPTQLIRGGRLRWRPRSITRRFLEETHRFPRVFRDESGTIHIAVSSIPPRPIVAPRPILGSKPHELSRKEPSGARVFGGMEI